MFSVVSVGPFGTLSIGTAAGEAATGAGVLNITSHQFGGGDGHIVFNHTAMDYVFDATISNGEDNAACGTYIGKLL